MSDEAKQALVEAVELRRHDPTYERRLSEIIEKDRELIERLGQ
jgi:hypothetical protein